jgi:alkylhydroperoxidase family enzyme
VEGLREAEVDAELIAAIQGDLAAAPLTPPELAMLQLAERLTLEPAAVVPAVRDAKAAGWLDEEVAHAIFLISYFNMVTRIANAFALPPDDSHPFNPAATLPLWECESP